MAKVKAKVKATSMGYYDLGQGMQIIREGQTFTYEGPRLPLWVEAIGKVEKIEDAKEAKVSAKKPSKKEEKAEDSIDEVV